MKKLMVEATFEHFENHGESGKRERGGRERERHSAKELKRKGEGERDKCEEEDREEETGKKTGER